MTKADLDAGKVVNTAVLELSVTSTGEKLANLTATASAVATKATLPSTGLGSPIILFVGLGLFLLGLVLRAKKYI